MAAVTEARGRHVVRERSGGLCEIAFLCRGRARATSWHHREGRAQGGTWSPANGLDACGDGTTGCHGFVTAYPALAKVMGWSVARGSDPSEVAVWSPLYERDVLLCPDGSVRFTP